MSIEDVDLVLRGMVGAQVDPTAKLVAVTIAEHARRGHLGVAWPSVPTIARLSCVSERQAQAILRKLVTAGWLFVERPSAGGRGNTTAYRLNLERMREIQKGEAGSTVRHRRNGEVRRTVPRAETVKSAPQKGEAQSGNGEAQRTETVKPASPEPVLSRITSPGFEPARACETTPSDRQPANGQTGGLEIKDGKSRPDTRFLRDRVPLTTDEQGLTTMAKGLGINPERFPSWSEVRNAIFRVREHWNQHDERRATARNNH